ncbi:MAG: PilN domain-containing protein [Gemmatimonadaceae bacterium]
MIEINLLPGSGKKARGRSSGIALGGALSGIIAQVKDPYLMGAAAIVILAAVATVGLWGLQQSTSSRLDRELQTAVQDSIRFGLMIKERRKVLAQRDEVLGQLSMIKTIDDNRFTWPHIMDEVSRALPPYTWLTSMAQTSAVPAPPGSEAPAPTTGARPAAPTPPGAKPPPAADSAAMGRLTFRLIGQTVDIQALTRFMKDLEASPFIENIQLVKSVTVIVENREVTEFQLDAAWETPDPSVIRTVPVALAVR